MDKIRVLPRAHDEPTIAPPPATERRPVTAERLRDWLVNDPEYVIESFRAGLTTQHAEALKCARTMLCRVDETALQAAERDRQWYVAMFDRLAESLAVVFDVLGAYEQVTAPSNRPDVVRLNS